MMKMKHLIAVAALSCAAALPAHAGEGGACHFHGSAPAPEATVVACAVGQKAALIKSGKLDASWQAVKQNKAELVDGKKGKEWKVTFKNAAAADKSKETLYLFYTPPGNFIAANFTGQ